MAQERMHVRFGPPEERGIKGWTPYSIGKEGPWIVVRALGIIPYMQVGTYQLSHDWLSISDPYASRPSQALRLSPTKIEIKGIGIIEEDGNMVKYVPARWTIRMFTRYPKEELRDAAISGMLHLCIAIGMSGG